MTVHFSAITVEKPISQYDLVNDGSPGAVPLTDHPMGQGEEVSSMTDVARMQFATTVDGVERPLVASMWRGFREKCPKCGEEMHHHHADDAPSYFTMFIVGHVIVGGVLWLEIAFSPPMWLELVIWLPLTVIMSLLLLPRIKGSLVALQWALRMDGFGGAEAIEDERVTPS
jgi:uncharacterized protein (DUF983 family)